MITTDREAAVRSGIDFVWCLTCDHHHIPTIPATTFRCADCGFGGWGLSIAATHADHYPEHIVHPVVHQVVPALTCEGCGDPYTDTPRPDDIVMAGGWCAPAELAYAPPRPSLCGDCTSRMLMVSQLGIDPGRHGENLRAPRGGITFPTPDGS